MYTDWQLTAHLYEYEVNSPSPKPEHRAWIQQHVPKYLRRGMRALIIGLASRTGTREYNIKLSSARAHIVGGEIQRLDYSSMLIDTQLVLGEEVAKLLGFKDGVEDGRWRGVFLDLYNQDRVPNYGPRLRPKKSVQRRVAGTFGIDQKETNRVPKSGDDAKADRWARRGNQARQVLGGEVTPHAEKLEWIDDTWTVTEVRVKVREVKDPWVETTWLDVEYTWGFPGAPKVLHYMDKKTPITADDAEDWLKKPVTSYRRKLWLRH
jgi:hypothetical protein